MRTIELGRGYTTVVDEDDYDKLSQYNWSVDERSHTTYVKRSVYEGGIRTGTEIMHRLIMDAPEDMQVDHINGDGLDNRKENLRLCSQKQNLMNKRSVVDSSSKHKGVCWDKGSSKWRAYIQVDKKKKHLGYYTDELAAASAYNEAAKEHFGEYAKVNSV